MGPLFAGRCQHQPVDSTLDEKLTNIVEDKADGLQDGEEELKTAFVKIAPELRQVPDSAISRLKNRKEFEYANDSAYWLREKQEQPRTIRGLPDIFNILVYLILIN